jgi:hypothetical protein
MTAELPTGFLGKPKILTLFNFLPKVLCTLCMSRMFKNTAIHVCLSVRPSVDNFGSSGTFVSQLPLI